MPFLRLVFPNLSPFLGSHLPLQPAWPQQSLLGQQDQWAHQAVVTMATGARQVGAQVGPPSVSPPRQPCCLRPAQPSPGWHYHHPSLPDSPVSGPLFLAPTRTGNLAVPPGQAWVWVPARFPKGSWADPRPPVLWCVLHTVGRTVLARGVCEQTPGVHGESRGHVRAPVSRGQAPPGARSAGPGRFRVFVS